jgi:flagellar protein FliO/FliZ
MLDVFGAEMPLAVRFFLAFLIVLGLIGAAAWAVRRFGSTRLGGTVRGRQPRLAVIDYASVDSRRRLILVRRDNIEHLMMIGGPTDVVVESNIVRAVPAAREPTVPRGPVAPEPLSRTLPIPEAGSNGSWPLQPESPATMRRSPRLEPLPEETGTVPPLSPEPPSRSQRDALNALVEDIAAQPLPPPAPPVSPTPQRMRPMARPQPSEPRGEQRPELPRLDTRAEPRLPTQPAPPDPSADQNLAEMAQRLEAALRKPKPVAPQFDEPEDLEASAPPPPPPMARPARPEPRPARAEARPKDAAPKESPKEGKALYDTLEQEMASLLGRPNKT